MPLVETHARPLRVGPGANFIGHSSRLSHAYAREIAVGIGFRSHGRRAYFDVLTFGTWSVGRDGDTNDALKRDGTCNNK
jgi:hypothetical protein